MPPGTKPGYRIGRDSRKMTARERDVLTALIWDTEPVVIANELGISKQRVNQIIRALEAKGHVEMRVDRIIVTMPRTKQQSEV
jgi:DNA-binding MarR family transcriptional regulator